MIHDFLVVVRALFLLLHLKEEGGKCARKERERIRKRN